MFKNYQSFLYKFDLIGANPQLFIFNDRRYKTIFSSITSIIIVLVSIIFGILSLNEYLKYENPIIVYSKDNDSKTQRIISIKDTILLFQLVDTSYNVINKDIAYYLGDFSIIFDNGTYENNKLEIENCEIGKNIDIKYKDYINEKYTFERKIEDFYCISFKDDNNKSLFYYPNIGYSYITLYIILKNNSKYTPEKIQSLIVSESDLIDHKNKYNPVNQNFDYHFTAAYSSLEYTNINYNFQFIKYESDNGLIYKKSKIENGISFSDMTSFRTIQNNYDLKKNFEKNNDFEIGRVTLGINKSYYDNYKRSYPRLQSLLAEIMSVVSLLFEIGRLVSYILCDKKMSKDIIKSILNKNGKNILNRDNSYIINNKLIDYRKNEKPKGEIGKSESEEKTKISSPSIDRNDISEENKIKNKNIKNEKYLQKTIINNAFKKINYYHIFKSLFCFKDNKTKFINLCHNIIIEEMSIETMLKRFNNLERIYLSFLSEVNNDNIMDIKSNRYNEILNYIYRFNDEIKNDKTNNE